jgi:hypothetical protein
MISEYFKGSTETFSNNQFISISPQQVSEYQEIWLTSLDTNIKTASNLFTSQCRRYVTPTTITFQIKANMNILNGGVFAKDIQDQRYIVVMSENESEFIELGELKIDNDHVYKLNSTVSTEFIKYKFMYIIHEFQGKKTILLFGKFK